MKKIRRVFALFLALVLSAALCVPAFAADTGDTDELVLDEGTNLVEPENKQFVIGKGSDAVVDNDSVAPGPRSLSLLFSITTSGGTGFQNLLVSGSSKTFKESDLTNGGLRINGLLYSDDKDTDTYLRAGYCIYNASTDEYVAADYARFQNGVYSSAFFDTNFWYSYTYYGFASKDTIGSSYAQGTLYFYNASE